MPEFDNFLKEKINELECEFDVRCPDMYDLIGSVRDLFSSPYISRPIVNPELVKNLWGVLTKIFLSDRVYDNKFDAIMTMSDVYIYSRHHNIDLSLRKIKQWRSEHNRENTQEEILECVDDILIE